MLTAFAAIFMKCHRQQIKHFVIVPSICGRLTRLQFSSTGALDCETRRPLPWSSVQSHRRRDTLPAAGSRSP